MNSKTPKIQIYDNFERFAKNNQSSQNSFPAISLKDDFTKLAKNYKTNQIAVSLSSKSLMCTVNEKEYHNAPGCSPYNLFCLYPKQFLKNMQKKRLKFFITACTSAFQLPFRTTQFNKVVQVNNKPCDAILYPKLSKEELTSCRDTLREKYPQHAIIFPRLDKVTHPELCRDLESIGFMMVPTRAVHIFHPDNDYMKRSHTKRDFSFLKKQNYQFVPHEELTNKDIVRIHQIYQMLFIEKHSKENPDLTLQFFQDSHAHRWYTFFGLRDPDTGVIDSFLSYEIEGDRMACGPLGYDTELDKAKGLYRMSFAHSLQIAHENRYVFNFGGANELFKLNRGSRKEIGYMGVYCKHLPGWRRFPWWFLLNVGELATIPILKKSIF